MVRKFDEYALMVSFLLFQAVFLLLCPSFFGNVVIFLGILNVGLIFSSIFLIPNFGEKYASKVHKKATVLLSEGKKNNYRKVCFVLLLQLMVSFLMFSNFEMSIGVAMLYLACVFVDVVAVVLEAMTVSYFIQKDRVGVALRKMCVHCFED